MNKMAKKAVTMATMIGVGAASWMMYKKKNPDALEDIKTATKNMASKMLNKLENME